MITSILQIIPHLDAGGAERTTLDIAAALTSRNIPALVLAEPDGRLIPELLSSGATFLPFPAASKNPGTLLLNVPRLIAIARRHNVALIHARSRAPAWTAFLAARHLKIPFVTTYHGVYNQSSAAKAFYNSVMARGDVVIANSFYTEQIILDRHPFARGRTQVIHRGTDLARFDPAIIPHDKIQTFRQSWGAQADTKILLLPARLTPWKGQRDLIEAAALLNDPNLLIILAGDSQGRDSYAAELQSRITTLHLNARIVGHVSDMPLAFAAADLVTTPSNEPEAFGRSAAEAQAMGIPVIASDLGGARETILAPPETLAHQRTGWRVPPSNPPALAAAIAEALALSPQARAELSARARLHAQNFSLKTMTDATLGVYERLLKRKLCTDTS